MLAFLVVIFSKFVTFLYLKPQLMIIGMRNLNSLFILLLLSIAVGERSKKSDNPDFTTTQMLKSLKSIIKCHRTDSDTKPVVAMTPHMFSKVVVLLKWMTLYTRCGKLGTNEFDFDNDKTWPFCLMGVCNKKLGTCNCEGAYVGDHCQSYIGSCWMMYCFIQGCKTSVQHLLCKCDKSYYGSPVRSGEYWYDDGVSRTYKPPPPGWQDSRTAHLMGYVPALQKLSKFKGGFTTLKKMGNEKLPPLPKVNHGGLKPMNKGDEPTPKINAPAGNEKQKGGGKSESDADEESSEELKELEEERGGEEDSRTSRLSPVKFVVLFLAFSITLGSL